MRTICFVLIGLFAWTFSFFKQADSLAIAVSMVLTAINCWLLAKMFYHCGWTNLPSWFVAATYWIIISSLPFTHTYWQPQLMIFALLTATLILLKINYQGDAIEESFLVTLICCFLTPIRYAIPVCCIVLWIYLIIKGYMNWRVWAASLIAITIHVLLTIVIHRFNILTWFWMENIPQLSWQQWAVAIGTSIIAFLSTVLPLRRPSIGSGIFYLICLLSVIGMGSASIILHFTENII